MRTKLTGDHNAINEKKTHCGDDTNNNDNNDNNDNNNEKRTHCGEVRHPSLLESGGLSGRHMLSPLDKSSS